AIARAKAKKAAKAEQVSSVEKDNAVDETAPTTKNQEPGTEAQPEQTAQDKKKAAVAAAIARAKAKKLQQEGSDK
ncbi:hypothetical protein CWB85_15470, partial [Pseudoalteromonas sp. S1727]